MLIFRFPLFVMLWAFVLCGPVCALAAPNATPNATFGGAEFAPFNVTLYPNSAKLTVKTTAAPRALSSGETVILAYLPGFADPETLTADLNVPLAAIKTRRLAQDDYSDPIRSPWQAKVEAATLARNAVQSEVNTARAIVNMWSNATAPTGNIATELTKMDSAMQKNLVVANTRLFNLEMQLAQAERQLSMAQEDFNRLSPSFEVSFVLAAPEAEAAAKREITYSYTLNNCGWQPVYTLNAQPDKENIAFGFAAKITKIPALTGKTLI